jgi:hypothetical protein
MPRYRGTVAGATSLALTLGVLTAVFPALAASASSTGAG